MSMSIITSGVIIMSINKKYELNKWPIYKTYYQRFAKKEVKSHMSIWENKNIFLCVGGWLIAYLAYSYQSAIFAIYTWVGKKRF